MGAVFILTKWSTCADHVEWGPQAFASFEAARTHANRLDTTGKHWWHQNRPGRALRWLEPKNHAGGFWEILTCEVAR